MVDRLRTSLLDAFRAASSQQRDALRDLLTRSEQDATLEMSLLAASVLWNVSFAGDGIDDSAGSELDHGDDEDFRSNVDELFDDGLLDLNSFE